MALHGEQGIGDELFFLRFAPELARRGANLAFRGDARLCTLLERTGHFGGGCAQASVSAPGFEAIRVGDLPGLLGADTPSEFPLALALSPDPSRIEQQRARLAAVGPAPWIALTWQAGVAAGPGEPKSRRKEVDPAALGAALRGVRGTWVSIQRSPQAGSREALQEALGAPVHDFSAANDDLEAMLALLALVRSYVGPSNTNTHLRAALGLSQGVLVPDPPEWRWLTRGDRSPWFPAMPVFRPDGNGRWESAFAALATMLREA